MHKLSFGALAGAALVLSTVGSAFAHAGISPATAANNATVKAVVTIPHGCDGAATDKVSIKLPEGFVNAKPMAKAGWQIAITKGDYSRAYDNHGTPVTSGALEITWSGGSLPDDQFDEFTVQGQFQGFDAESPALFITTQKCGATEVTGTRSQVPARTRIPLNTPPPPSPSRPQRPAANTTT